MDFSSEASEEEEWETVVDLNNQNASEEKSIHDDDEQVADKEICIDLNPLEEVTSKKQTSLKAHRSVHLTHIISMVLGYSIMNSTANTKKLQSEILKIVPSNILEAVNRKRNKITEPEKEFKNLIRSILIWFKNEIRVEKGEVPISSIDNLLSLLKNKRGTVSQVSILFVALLRALGFETRLIVSFLPIPLRVPMLRKMQEKKEEIKSLNDEIKEENEYTNNLLWCEIMLPASKNISGKYIPFPILQDSEFSDCTISLIEKYVVWSYPTFPPYIIAFHGDTKAALDVTPRYLEIKESTNVNDVLVKKKVYDLEWFQKKVQTNRAEPEFSNFLSLYNSHWRVPEYINLDVSQDIWTCINENLFKKNRNHFPKISNNHESSSQILEKVPTTIKAVQQSSSYVLERNIKKNHALYRGFSDCPEFIISKKENILVEKGIVSVGSIRGESIYLKNDQSPLLSKQSWLIRFGRILLPDAEPVGMKAAPKSKKKSVAPENGTDLYGIWQTKLYQAPRIPDSNSQIVPMDGYYEMYHESEGGKRNDSIPLFHPFMLPENGVHIKRDDFSLFAMNLLEMNIWKVKRTFDTKSKNGDKKEIVNDKDIDCFSDSRMFDNKESFPNSTESELTFQHGEDDDSDDVAPIRPISKRKKANSFQPSNNRDFILSDSDHELKGETSNPPSSKRRRQNPSLQKSQESDSIPKIVNVADICHSLNIPFAVALTGFSMVSGRRFVPDLDSIVVHKDHADVLRAAILETAKRVLHGHNISRQRCIIKRWESLVKKLSVWQSVKNRFGV